MTIHTLSPKFFEDLKFRYLTRIVPFTTALYFGVLWQVARQKTNNPDFDRLVLGITMGLAIFVYCIVMAISTAMTFKQYHRRWTSYKILLEEDSITRIQLDLEDICIARSEIKKIIQLPEKALVIEVANSQKRIAIPETLENFSVVKSILTEWSPIEDVSNARRYLNGPLGGISLIFSPLVLIAIASRITQEPLIVAGGLTLYLLMLGYCLVLTMRNPNIDRKTKFIMGFAMVPIICALGSVIFSSLLA